MSPAVPQIRSLQARPLAEQARDLLLAAIREDRFPDGRLPPEAELATALGVSRGTLRGALQSLSADGIISRRRRHGTVVNAHVLRSSMRLNRLVSFAELVAQSGYQSSTDPEQRAVVSASASQAAELGLASGTDVLRVERLLRADGEPVIKIIDVIDLARLTRPLSKLRVSSTTFEFLQHNAETTIDYAISETIPRVATESEPAGLEMEPGTPYVELHEVHYSVDNERIALSEIAVVDRLVRLSTIRRGH